MNFSLNISSCVSRFLHRIVSLKFLPHTTGVCVCVCVVLSRLENIGNVCVYL